MPTRHTIRQSDVYPFLPLESILSHSPGLYAAQEKTFSSTFSARSPSEHTQTVPARVPYVIPHGARTVFPAGTRRDLSAGWRRVPYGITHPGSAWYPSGSRLIIISRDPYGYHAEPGWVIPSVTRLHPADKNRRVPARNTLRDP